jgi:hypothetical protein
MARTFEIRNVCSIHLRQQWIPAGFSFIRSRNSLFDYASITVGINDTALYMFCCRVFFKLGEFPVPAELNRPIPKWVIDNRLVLSADGYTCCFLGLDFHSTSSLI